MGQLLRRRRADVKYCNTDPLGVTAPPPLDCEGPSRIHSDMTGPFDEPAKALAEVAKLVSVAIRPATTFLQANADAYHLKKLTQAQIEADDLRARAARTAENDGIQRQFNREAAIARTQQILPQMTRKALPKNASGKKLDADWIFQWAKYVQEVSDDEVRTLWAKVLAGEIIAPGGFSLRTLQTLSLLAKADAERFALLANYITEDATGALYHINNQKSDAFLEKKCAMTYDFYAALQEAGLLDNTPFLGATLQPGQTISLRYAGKIFNLTCTDSEERLRLRVLTTAGKQLFSLCTPEPDWEYFKLLWGSVPPEVASSDVGEKGLNVDQSVPPAPAVWLP